MGRVQFKEDRAGVKALFAAPFMVDEMVRRAEKMQRWAIANSPERTGRYRWGSVRYDVRSKRRVIINQRRRRTVQGRYRIRTAGGGGFHVTGGIKDGHAHAELVNDTPYARFLEFGTRYMRKQRILGRAMDHARD